MQYSISSQRYSLTVTPKAGGRIESFRYHSNGVDVDIFRPRPDMHPEVNKVPHYGSFVMVPFCNRLLPLEMICSEGKVPVAMNWPQEECAIHGLCVESKWDSGRNTDPGACALNCSVTDASGNQLGIAFQRFEISDQNGLRLRAGFRNDAFDWILAGVGFHPWFFVPEAEAVLEFQAQGRFITNKRHFPESYQTLDNSCIELRSSTHNGLDQCFGGWSGEATLQLPQLPAPLTITSGTSNLHVYFNDRLQSVCIEPVTNVTNATHDERWKEFAGMKKLNRGETLEIDMQIVIDA